MSCNLLYQLVEAIQTFNFLRVNVRLVHNHEREAKFTGRIYTNMTSNRGDVTGINESMEPYLHFFQTCSHLNDHSWSPRKGVFPIENSQVAPPAMKETIFCNKFVRLLDEKIRWLDDSRMIGSILAESHETKHEGVRQQSVVGSIEFQHPGPHPWIPRTPRIVDFEIRDYFTYNRLVFKTLSSLPLILPSSWLILIRFLDNLAKNFCLCHRQLNLHEESSAVLEWWIQRLRSRCTGKEKGRTLFLRSNPPSIFQVSA